MGREWIFWLLTIGIQVWTALRISRVVVREDVHRDFGVKYGVTVIYHPNQDTQRMKGAPWYLHRDADVNQGCKPARTPGRPESTEVWEGGD